MVRTRRKSTHSKKRATDAASALLRIELRGIDPLIWRRIRVPANFTLQKVHRVIQAAFSWQDCHRHQFEVGPLRIGLPEANEDDDAMQDERKWTLTEVLSMNVSEFRYVYDFGDCWEHRVIVEPETRTEAGARFAPLCLAGEHAAPPEEVGGARGYKLLRHILANPEHDRFEEMLEWIGGIWDAKGFDLNQVNRALRGA